ncbi:hypothetical protein [Paenibacillus elgii]|uniref:hypothetical protein n=1 Tax=Paenibacillus elgii TaxID=189691 RepID=UPI000FD7688C|nr:hypothetical protein [Paenibacillus elgii]NEN82796.1 hypothetical protein [Paenibacillus elgii]
MKNIKNQVIFLASLVVLIVTISISVGLIIAYLQAGKDWIGSLIGSLGNIIGGIIGGFVAYFVAAYQIQKNNDFEKLKQNARNKNLLTLVVEELTHINKIISIMISQGRFSPEIAKNQITIGSWDVFKVESALVLPIYEFSQISSTYRRINILKHCLEDDIDLPRLQLVKEEIDRCILTLERYLDSL